MKIDYVSAYFYPARGGIETYVHQLSQHLAALGNEVTVHTSLGRLSGPDRKATDRFGAVSVRRYRMYPGWFLFPELDRPGVVHANNMGWNPNLVEAFRRGRHGRVLTPHGALFTFWYPAFTRSAANRRLLRSLLGRYDTLIAQTQVEKDHLVATIGLDPGKVVLVRTGVDDSFFAPAGSTSSPKLDALGLDGHRFILSVGRIAQNKRFWVGVRALSELDRSVHYVVAGPNVDPRTTESLVREADQLGVRDRFHLIGPVGDDEKRALLQRANAVLVPGWEAYSITAVEAMAVGTPVVGSDCVCLSETLGYGARGLLFDFDEPRTAAERVRELLEDRDRATTLSRAGRSWVFENCRWGEIARQMNDVYGRALAREA